MHLLFDKVEVETKSQFGDCRVSLSFYLSVSEMHEWREMRLDTFLLKLEEGISLALRKTVKRPKKHVVMIDKE